MSREVRQNTQRVLQNACETFVNDLAMCEELLTIVIPLTDADRHAVTEKVNHVMRGTPLGARIMLSGIAVLCEVSRSPPLHPHHPSSLSPAHRAFATATLSWLNHGVTPMRAVRAVVTWHAWKQNDLISLAKDLQWAEQSHAIAQQIHPTRDSVDEWLHGERARFAPLLQIVKGVEDAFWDSFTGSPRISVSEDLRDRLMVGLQYLRGWQHNHEVVRVLSEIDLGTSEGRLAFVDMFIEHTQPVRAPVAHGMFDAMRSPHDEEDHVAWWGRVMRALLEDTDSLLRAQQAFGPVWRDVLAEERVRMAAAMEGPTGTEPPDTMRSGGR